MIYLSVATRWRIEIRLALMVGLSPITTTFISSQIWKMSENIWVSISKNDLITINKVLIGRLYVCPLPCLAIIECKTREWSNPKIKQPPVGSCLANYENWIKLNDFYSIGSFIQKIHSLTRRNQTPRPELPDVKLC